MFVSQQEYPYLGYNLKSANKKSQGGLILSGVCAKFHRNPANSTNCWDILVWTKFPGAASTAGSEQS